MTSYAVIHLFSLMLVYFIWLFTFLFICYMILKFVIVPLRMFVFSIKRIIDFV